MKIVHPEKVVEAIGRLQGRANSYENAGNQTRHAAKKEACLSAAQEMRDFASMLAESFDEPERAILHEEYLKAVGG